jgi:glutamyl-tRNA reductase
MAASARRPAYGQPGQLGAQVYGSMKIVLLGVNHKTAPIELRERLAISPANLAEATRSLREMTGIQEALILSTCNRVELVTCHEEDSPRLLELIWKFIENYFHIDPQLVQPHLYEYSGGEAIRHLFRIASGLDSMVIGEPQILGQVKESYLAARSVGAVRSHLDRLLQRTFTVAKRVRSETQIGSSTVSIASVAVELAQRIFGSLADKRVFLVGAGKMSELAARHLMAQGAGAVFVTNRTQQRAETLAQTFNSSAVRFEDLYATAAQADIIITSTGASQPIFRKDHAQLFLQRRRGYPLFFIDIGVPRDVDPEVNQLDGIFLYDIDDLQSVASSHLDERGKEAELAEAMIAAEVEQYQRRLQALNVVPEIVHLQRSAEEIRQAEHRRLESHLQSLSPEQAAAVEMLTRSLVNKLLHHPFQAIKSAAEEGNAVAVDASRQAFGLHLTCRYGVGEQPLEHPVSAARAQEVGNGGIFP